MYYVISIINPDGEREHAAICAELGIPLLLTTQGKGTATKSMRDLLGIESREKRVAMTIANQQQTQELIANLKQRLYIDAPNNGIVITIPVKSVGGGKTLSFLSGGQKMKAPELNLNYELIVVIANEGCTEIVMDAARSAGARGGTVLHAKGTGADNAEKFFKVSIAQEKEVILIVSKKDDKAAIMSSILSQAGAGTEAGAITFSLPVTAVDGFKLV